MFLPILHWAVMLTDFLTCRNSFTLTKLLHRHKEQVSQYVAPGLMSFQPQCRFPILWTGIIVSRSLIENQHRNFVFSLIIKGTLDLVINNNCVNTQQTSGVANYVVWQGLIFDITWISRTFPSQTLSFDYQETVQSPLFNLKDKNILLVLHSPDLFFKICSLSLI